MTGASGTLRFGPFAARVNTTIPAVGDGLRLLYPWQFSADDETFVDFDIEMVRPLGPRRWYRPQVLFRLDGEQPFFPLPAAQALSTFEWGLNICVGSRAHQYLIFHAAAIERGGRVAILPGAPQSGKSTLTACLVHRGWRLLSDELSMVSLADGLMTPLARPIHLKNRSIDIIRDYIPGVVISPEVPETQKGTVALLRAPEDSVRRMDEKARARWIVFPRWRADGPVELVPVKKAGAFLELARNGINYSIHGARGFERTADLVESCDCLSFRYTRLDDAVAAFDELAAKP